MMLVKQDLSTSIPKQIDQGTKVVTLSTEVMPDKPAVLLALKAANDDLLAKQSAALAARAAAKTATEAAYASAAAQRAAFSNMAGHVTPVANGDLPYIYTPGLLARNPPPPPPPLTEPPADLTTRVNGVPGRIVLSWTG